MVLNKRTRLVAMYYAHQDSATWADWHYRTLSEAKAEELEREGKATRIFRMHEGQGRCVGFRMTEIMRSHSPSPTTLTMATMIAVGNACKGYRPTRGEINHIIKFRVWPLMGDSRAVAVRPRLSLEETLQAERLLGIHGQAAANDALKQAMHPAA